MSAEGVSRRHFWKLSGSGNDFVFFDARREAPGALADPDVVSRVCARGTGVGADGIVFIQHDGSEEFRIRYLNRDGSLGELCGNASLCTARLAVELGMADPGGFRFNTDAGVIAARIATGEPEIDLQPVPPVRSDAGIPLSAGEVRIGFALVGVPHLVVLVSDLAGVDVSGRGQVLRHHRSLTAGANVNFIAQSARGDWEIRTYERGVEAETLACGTGSVASACMLSAWGLGGATTKLLPRSGKVLTVRLQPAGSETCPSLRGEGRIVFEGDLRAP